MGNDRFVVKTVAAGPLLNQANVFKILKLPADSIDFRPHRPGYFPNIVLFSRMTEEKLEHIDADLGSK